MSKDKNPHETESPASGNTASLRQKLNIPNDEAVLTHPAYEELQKKLNEAEQKAQDNWDRLLRQQAEVDNMRRRVERDIESAHKYGLEKFVNELLPVIDSLERSLVIDPQGQNSILEGVALTVKMFHNVLEKFGVQQIDPESQPFNPEFHQAVSTVVDPNLQPNTVVNVLQKGYLLNGRLIRPALVTVSKTS